jgi:hypothetical protein
MARPVSTALVFALLAALVTGTIVSVSFPATVGEKLVVIRQLPAAGMALADPNRQPFEGALARENGAMTLDA